MKLSLSLLFALSSVYTVSCTVEKPASYDIVIRSGLIVDGSGNVGYSGDIGIVGDIIARVGDIPEDSDALVVDASGKMVTPGFIDIHTHADGGILDDRTAHNFIAQGVTTVVGGNCGGSRLNLRDFFADIESEGTALNIGILVGHNSVRSKVMGNEGREPTSGELDSMKAIIAEEMEAGALGLSTGLKYRPGVYAKTDEVVELAKVAARYGGFYASHLRDEGLGFYKAVEEAIDVGRRAGIPVQLSHHKAVGADMWGATERTLAMIDDACASGLDVTADQYAYRATSTGIGILFPAWSLEGNADEIRTRLSDPATRKKVIDGIVDNIRHDRGGNDIRNVAISSCGYDRSFEGKNLAEILAMKGREPTMENAAVLLIEINGQGGASAVFHCLSEDDVTRVMKHPRVMHGSDASITEFGSGAVHPRNYGNFPRVLGRYVREQKVLALEEAIRKMTSLPASRIGAADRGRIDEGMAADIVIFDPERIQDTATYTDPHRYPEGIDCVMVNGVIVVKEGEITGKLPGRVIYGPGKR